MIAEFKGTWPQIDPTAFVEKSAIVIGDVVIGAYSSIWFNAIVRGDIHYIRIGQRTNIQDGCILHVTAVKFPLVVGNNVTVGHGAILHGCTIEDNCLIGMGARILDGARVGSYSIIAAGSVVREGQRVPERTLVAGVPAEPKRTVTPEEIASIEQSAEHYVGYLEEYKRYNPAFL